MSWLRLALLILMRLFARDTYAQTDNRFAIGVDYVVRAPDHAAGEDYAHGKLGPDLRPQPLIDLQQRRWAAEEAIKQPADERRHSLAR